MSRRRRSGAGRSGCSEAWTTPAQCSVRSRRGGCSRRGARTCGRCLLGVWRRGLWCWCWRCGRCGTGIGASRTMWLGWLAYAGVAAGFAVARGAGAAWTLFLAFGIVADLTESPERALVAQFAGAHQGSGFGMYHGVTGLAALAGGVGMGAVFQAYGAGTAFVGSAAGGLALTVVWPVVMLRRVA